jgi:hypothetical protein
MAPDDRRAAQMGRIDPAATRGRTAPSRVGRRRRPVSNCGTGAASASLLPSHARGRPDTALTVVTASRWERARRGQPPRRLQGTTRRSPSRRETRNRFVERLQSSAPGRTTRSRVVRAGRVALGNGDARNQAKAADVFRISMSTVAASASSRSAGPWTCRRPPTISAPRGSGRPGRWRTSGCFSGSARCTRPTTTPTATDAPGRPCLGPARTSGVTASSA